MAEASDNMTLMLGEIRGQLRELIHNMNNHSQKQDALARIVSKLESVPDQLDKIDQRLTKLETDKNLRDGAMGFGTWLLKTPLVTWAALAALAVWTWMRGTGK